MKLLKHIGFIIISIFFFNSNIIAEEKINSEKKKENSETVKINREHTTTFDEIWLYF